MSTVQGTATPTSSLKLTLPTVSGWFLPAAIGLVILVAATWTTKARPYVVGLALLILLGIVLQWGPAIETQTQSLLTNLKPASPSTPIK
jgi:uncharacterized membrane protein HdeD (DUF308 family)